MPQEQRQSFFSRLAYSRLLLILEIVILVLIGVSFGQETVRKYQVEHEIKKLQEQVDTLEHRNTELAQLIDYFQSDQYKERQARTRLGLVKEGESILVVPGVSGSEPGGLIQETANSSRAVSASNPQKWWNYFFEKKIDS